MSRPHPYNLLYELEIGEHALVEPKTGESLKMALGRIKLRLSKYRKDERSFYATIEDAAIRVERVPFGLNSKYWPWIALRENERLLVAEEATETSKRQIQQSIQFLHNQARYGKLWEWREIRGKLFVECVFDRNQERTAKTLTPPTREEILRRDIHILQGNVERMRRSGASDGTRVWLARKCDIEEERISELRRELNLLVAPPIHPPIPR